MYKCDKSHNPILNQIYTFTISKYQMHLVPKVYNSVSFLKVL